MIAIRLVSLAGGTPAAPLEAVFDERGGDIGRAVECTLVLPDPERRISRKHLQVAWREGRHFLRLISSNLLVELDGVPLQPGMEFPLEPGAQIRIGPFELQAALHGLPASGPVPAAPPAAGAPAATGSLDDLLAAPRPAGRASVFHDLLHPEEGGPAAPARAEGPAAMPLTAQDIDLVIGDPTGANLRPQPSVDDLVLALFAGLGLAAPAPAARTPAQMETIGALLRATIEGTLGLLAARGIAKRELGASETLVQTRQNNPLKFSADASTALIGLLAPPQRGFIPALAAVRETYDDLRAHEMAILAGMRAALEAAIARFDPATLEERWAEKGVWENLRPVNHKAKLWERYAEQHAEIAREIEENFDSIFSQAFAAAYEAQRARLTRRS